MSAFYDQVLLEIMLALGGALFVGNALALARRRNDAGRPGGSVSNRAKRGGDFANSADLAQAPVTRTVTYMLIGLVVAVWALASLVIRG